MSEDREPGNSGLLRDWIAELRFALTVFSSFAATHKQEMLLTLPELDAMVASTTATAKTVAAAKAALPWLKLAIFGTNKTPFRTGTNGKRTGGSLRHDANIIAITGIEADYDGGIMSVDEVVEILTKIGILAMVYTSPSHTEDAPRFRVLCPFSEPMRSDTGSDNLMFKRIRQLNRLNGACGGIFSGESWTFSQSYYYGRANSNPSHRVVIVDGRPIDLLDELDITAKSKPGGLERPPTGAPRLISQDGQIQHAPRQSLDEKAAIEAIITGAAYHVSVVRLAGKWASAGLPRLMCRQRLWDAFDACAEETKDQRWAERREAIERELDFVYEKEAAKRDKGKARAEARAKVEAEQEQDDDRDLPTITILPGLRHKAVDLGLAAMRQAKVKFYTRHLTLVRVAKVEAKDGDGGKIWVPGLVNVTLAVFARELGTAAHWEKFLPSGHTKRIDPPRDVVEQAAALSGEWPFDPLLGVISTQTLRPDGSILWAEGYDAQTGLYLHAPPAMPQIPKMPTKADALAALAALAELLASFPFADAASKSVAMSMLMTPVLRGALAPAVPLHVVSAPTSGTGKSYIMNLTTAIAVGEPAAVMSMSPREEENEKRLVAAALSGHPIIAIDNCNGLLTGDFLAQVTSSSRMTLRPLGGSDQVVIHNTFTVLANGNNIVISKDLVRRTVRCLLDANTDDPASRTFDTKPVRQVLADRGKYVAAILTIARAYIVAGMPDPPHQRPGFERWSTLVCGALVWLGWANPSDSTADLKADDPERQNVGVVFEAFPQRFTSYTTAELIEAATEADEAGPLNLEWAEAIKLIARNKRGELDVLPLGQWLGAHKGQMYGRLKLERSGTPTRPRWGVVQA